MLKTLRNAWKIKEIRTKLIFTFLMLVVIRFGSELPIPGVKTTFSRISSRISPLMHLDFSMR